MNVAMAVLRLIHIFGSVFWVGVVWYNALFGLPRARAFGADRGRIVQTLTAPPFPQSMTAASWATALSGILLYGIRSGGFSRAWMTTSGGMVLGLAGVLGLLVAVEGFVVQRPIGMRLAALARQTAAAGGPPGPAVAQEMQALSDRLERATYRGAYLLALAAIGMAVFRYV